MSTYAQHYFRYYGAVFDYAESLADLADQYDRRADIVQLWPDVMPQDNLHLLSADVRYREWLLCTSRDHSLTASIDAS